MKIIHTADLHIDSKMESNLSVEKAKERRNEIKQTFVRLIEYAKKHEVKIIIIAGDLFDTNEISNRTKNLILDLIRQNTDISFLFLNGNHDESIYKEENIPENFLHFENNWTYFNFDDITIAGITLGEKYNENIFDNLHLSENRKNIVVLHGQITKGSIEYVPYGINLNLLKNKNIDYLALGHIHEYSFGKLDDRGYYAYSGALEGRGFDECGEKGFIFLEFEQDGLKHLFVPFATRKFYELEIDVSHCSNMVEIMQLISKNTKDIGKENLIKIILKGELEKDFEKDIDYLLTNLNEKYYFVKIEDKTKIKIDLQALQADISLKGEYIRQVLGSNEIPEEDKNDIIMYGIKALEGEDF